MTDVHRECDCCGIDQPLRGVVYSDPDNYVELMACRSCRDEIQRQIEEMDSDEVGPPKILRGFV